MITRHEPQASITQETLSAGNKLTNQDERVARFRGEISCYVLDILQLAKHILLWPHEKKSHQKSPKTHHKPHFADSTLFIFHLYTPDLQEFLRDGQKMKNTVLREI